MAFSGPFHNSMIFILCEENFYRSLTEFPKEISHHCLISLFNTIGSGN